MKNVCCFLQKLLTDKQKRTKLLLIALVAVLSIMAVTVAVNMAGNPDYLYELLWNFDADEGEAYARLEGTTLVVTSRPGFGKVILGSTDMEEWKSSITKVVIEDEFAPLFTSYWFEGMSELETVEGLEKLDMSRVLYTSAMFRFCENLRELNGISNWDTSSAIGMAEMFWGCKSLTALDLSAWDVSNVTTMGHMFADSGLVEVKGLENWNVAELRSVSGLFKNCKSLQNVGDLNKWNVADCCHAFDAFDGCTSLLTLPPYWAE